MNIPRGTVLQSRVVTEPARLLESVLDRELTGYVTIEPQDTLLLGSTTRGILTFEDGVPVLAYDVATDSGGAAALAQLAIPGPSRVELYESRPEDLRVAHETDELVVPPGMPAEELGDAPSLAERTREAAPPHRLDDGPSDTTALESFLADDERIDAIKAQAKAEAAERAAEWGLDDQLTDSDTGTDRAVPSTGVGADEGLDGDTSDSGTAGKNVSKNDSRDTGETPGTTAAELSDLFQ